MQFATGIRPFNNLAHDAAIGLKIFQGENPLDNMIEHHKDNCELILENRDLEKILRMCF